MATTPGTTTPGDTTVVTPVTGESPMMTLYGPNGEIRTFNLPLSEADAAEVARLRKEGYSETKATTPTPTTTGGGGKRTQVESDPNKWMEKYDYRDIKKLTSQTSEMLNQDPKRGVIGLIDNARTAAETAANIIIMKSNGASKEEVAKATSEYNQFIKDAKLEYFPKGIMNGDRLSKDIAANNIDIALFKDTTDPFGNPIFKDANDFNRFSQKIGPKGRGSKGIEDAFTRVKQRTKDLGTTSTGTPPQRPDNLVKVRTDSTGKKAGDVGYESALKKRQSDKRKKYQKEQREKMQKKNVDFTKKKLKEFKKTGKVTGFDKGGLMNKKGKK